MQEFMINLKTCGIYDETNDHFYRIGILDSMNKKLLLQVGMLYIIGDYLYEYVGPKTRISGLKEGIIFKKEDSYYIKEYDTEDIKKKFHISKIIDEKNIGDCDLCDILQMYEDSYKSGDNAMIENKNTLLNSGNVFIPVIEPDDEPLTVIIKTTLINKQISLSTYNDMSSKNNKIFNMRSALCGQTKSLSISYFRDWCELLECDWKFEVWDCDDSTNPIGEHLEITNHHNLFREVPEDAEIPFGAFVPELDDDDDPMKRLIKCALIIKRISPKDYKNKGSSKFSFNNMKSAIRGAGAKKMSIKYFRLWCEMLSLQWRITVTDKDHGEVSISSID